MIHTDNVKLTKPQVKLLKECVREVYYLIHEFPDQMDEDLLFELFMRGIAISQGELPRP